MFLRLRNININIDNLSYLVQKDDKFYLNYRKKASIKSIEVPIDFENMTETPSQFFAKLGIFRLEDYWINPKNISFIEEINKSISESRRDEPETDLLIYFSDGLMLDLTVYTSRWNVWKGTRLQNA